MSAKRPSNMNRRDVTYLLEYLGPALALVDLSFLHTVTNTDKLSIDVLETSLDSTFDCLLQLLLDKTCREWAEGFVEQVVLRVPNAELEGVDLDVHVLNSENGCWIVLARLRGRADVRGDGKAIAAKKDVGDTGVGELGQSGLLAEVECDVFHIGLNLTESESELVVGLVAESYG